MGQSENLRNKYLGHNVETRTPGVGVSDQQTINPSLHCALLLPRSQLLDGRCVLSRPSFRRLFDRFLKSWPDPFQKVQAVACLHSPLPRWPGTRHKVGVPDEIIQWVPSQCGLLPKRWYFYCLIQSEFRLYFPHSVVFSDNQWNDLFSSDRVSKCIL